MQELLTIREVAKIVGVNKKTIVSWEKRGKIKKAKRDKKGWRVYDNNDLDKLIAFFVVKSFL